MPGSRGAVSLVRLGRAGWLRALLFAMVVAVGLQLLPPGVVVPGLGPGAAFADTPASPPAPVNPAPKVVAVTTPGPTEVSGLLTKDTVWSAQGSPYVLRSGLTVPAGVSLTLLPGTVVKMQGSGLYVEGQLLVLGTPNQRVVFTSLKDDSVLGDTNSDGSATTPGPGDWSSVHISGIRPSRTGEPTTLGVIDYADFRYGGYGLWCNYDGQLELDNDVARLTVTNSSFSNSQNSQIYISATPTNSVALYSNTFNQAGGAACGVMDFGGSADVIGNTFNGVTLSTIGNGASPARIWRNTFSVGLNVKVTDDNAVVPRSSVDIRFNTLLGHSSENGHFDWSDNWWGHDANVYPSCVTDSDQASNNNPPLHVANYDPTTCHGWHLSGYEWNVLPALSGPPATALPSVLAAAAAPQVGPVDTSSGALTYRATDMSVADAGRSIMVDRTYRSDRSGSGDLGAGWSTSYSESMSTTAGSSTLLLGDGSVLPFPNDPAAGYTPAPGMSADYTTDSNGSTITTPDRTSYQFNPAGDLTGMTLGDTGHKLSIGRQAGQVATVTGVSGRHVDYTRSNGLLQAVADSTGRTVQFAHVGGRLTSATGVDGHTEVYGYDGDDHLTRVTTPTGLVKLAVGYDASGRVAWLDQLGSGHTTFAYDPATASTTATLADGSKVTQRYDPLGRMVTERIGSAGHHVVYDGFGRVIVDVAGVPSTGMTGYGPAATTTLYDFAGNPALLIDPRDNYTNTTFNTAHQPLVTTRNDGSTISRGYDGNGRLSTVVDPRGKTWTYTYNSFGEVTQQTDPVGRHRSVAYAADGDVTTTSDETGATTSYGTDPQGRITSVTDPLGHQTQAGYTPWDQITQLTSPRGGTLTITYDADRRRTEVSDPTGAATVYEYDTAGRLSATVDPAGKRTSYGYDPLGRQTSVTDPRGSITRRTYTAEGWASTTTDPVGATTSYTNDPSGRAVRVTDPTNATIQTVHDRDGNTIELDTPDGATRTWAYDQSGRMTAYTSPNGGTETITYDAAGNVTQDLEPVFWDGYRYTHYGIANTYDNAGRLSTTTDQMGTVTSYTYDDTTRTVTATDPLGTAAMVTRNAAGQIASRTDGARGVTGYGYDLDGNLTTITDPTGRVDQYAYDLDRRPVSHTDPAGHPTTISYDLAGRITGRLYPGSDSETFGYDAAGNLTDHADRTGAHWSYAYDPAGQLTTATDPLGHATTYTWDANGRQTSVTDPSGMVTHTAYDPLGRPAVTWDATGASWVTSYDPDGNITKTVDPAGVTSTYQYDIVGELTAVYGPNYATYSYDGAGRLTQQTAPYAITYGYDVRSRTTSITDAYNHATTYSYDGAGRRLSTTTPSGHTRSATYDVAGRITSATDGAGDTSHYTYDNAGRPATLTLPRGGVYRYTYTPDGDTASQTDPLNAVTSYSYDGEGRPTQTTYPSGRSQTLGYDAAGRLTSETSGTAARSYTYDAAGRLTNATIGSSSVGYSYDNRGLLTGATDALGTTTYGYDNAHRLTSRTPPAGTATTIGYDNYGRPTTIGGPTSITLTYNNAGQVTDQTGTGLHQYFYYDYNGRPTHTDTTGATYNSDGQIATLTQYPPNYAPADTTTMTYDPAGRLLTAALSRDGSTVSTTSYGWDADSNRTRVSTTGQPDLTTSYNLADQPTTDSTGAAYTYNSDADLTTVTGAAAPASYHYDPFGLLDSATTPAGAVTYTHDALGRTTTRTANTTTQTLSYEATSTDLAAQQTGTTTTNMVRDPAGRVLAEATVGATTQRVGTTIHGDLSQLVNAQTGSTTWSSAYDPFGEATTTGTAPVALGFQSMYTDPTTGLVDMGARQYNPGTGTFTTADTLTGDPTSVATLNRYLYGNGDPVNHIDPDGHSSCDTGSWLDRFVCGWNSDELPQGDGFLGGLTDAFTATAIGTINTVDDAATCVLGQEQHCQQLQDQFSWNNITSSAKQMAHQAKTCVTQLDGYACGQTTFNAINLAVGAKGATSLATSILRTGRATVAGIKDLAGTTLRTDADATANTLAATNKNPLATTSQDNLANLQAKFGDYPAGRLKELHANPDAGGISFRRGSGDAVDSADAADPSTELQDHGQSGDPTTCHSFDPSTPVLMANGTSRAIKDIQPGDDVVATDPATGQTTDQTVTALHVNQDTDLTDLTLSTTPPTTPATSRTDNGEATTQAGTAVLHTTAHHQFWDATAHRWVNAADLQVGDRLTGPQGQTDYVTAVHAYTGNKTMHDLTIATVHTYYVIAGNTPVLVHNCGYAEVFLDKENAHASIAVTHDGTTIHTEQSGTTGTDAVGSYFQGAVSNSAIRIRIPLPNAARAQAFQKATEGYTFDRYDLETRSCVTYCLDVLREGGVKDVPDPSVGWRRSTLWIFSKDS
jgi:RHS repeat-associated protein